MAKTVVLFKELMWPGGYLKLSTIVKDDYFVFNDEYLKLVEPLIIQLVCECKYKKPNGKYSYKKKFYPWTQINVARSRMRIWYDKYFKEAQEAWEDFLEYDAERVSENEDDELPW